MTALISAFSLVALLDSAGAATGLAAPAESVATTAPPQAAASARTVPLLAASQVPSASASSGPAVVRAARLSGPVTVDGTLSEEAWNGLEPFTALIQRDPVEGARPSQRTEVRVAYDDDAIYVGARLYDSAPDSVVARLARRDASIASDRFAVYLDPYRDRRSGYYFMINAAGTMYDGTLSNDVDDDKSWDGVWAGSARTDAQGWTAEIRIPFSQLRFANGSQHAWGINFAREIPRRREKALAAYRPRKASGFVSRFPELTGLESVPPARSLELLPYATSQAQYIPAEPGDPFNDGSKLDWNGGADLRTRLSDLTLNATVNPDFGQVEIDPSTVNLTDYEDFFEEKRPFFVEGSGTFAFGRQGAGDYWDSDWDDPLFFYSRRIGRGPQGRVPRADFEDVPVVTRILGAAKLIGRIGPHWSLGTLHAITRRESASLYRGGIGREVELEPPAYYQATRVQREIGDRRAGVGLLGTIAARQFEDPALKDQLNASSFMAGLDGWYFLDGKRKWVLSGWSALSHVTGTERRMISLQRSSTHYFQRPDAGHVEVDSSITSLSGFATRWWLNKEEGAVLFNAGAGFVDPGFEVNDLGFQRRSDILNGHLGSGYKWTKPALFWRYQTLKGTLFTSLDNGGNVTRRGVEGSGYTEFRNGHTLNYYTTFDAQALNNRRTRGGPLTLNLPGFTFGTDYMGNTQQRTYPYASFGGTATMSGTRYFYVYPGMEWRPSPAWSVKVSLGWEQLLEDAQYVNTVSDPSSPTYGRRYVFATLDQSTASASLRLNWTLTPRLGLQTYMQPFWSSADHHDFKMLAEARTYDFIPVVYPDDQDFTQWSIKGNAVLRWEYLPGSSLYLVWTHKRSDFYSEPRVPVTGEMVTASPPENILLLKLSYYFTP